MLEAQRFETLPTDPGTRPKRLLALTRYERQGASSRLRSLQYVPFLEAAGFEVDTLALFDADYLAGLYSGARPRLGPARALARRIGALRGAGGYDLIWIEKEALPWLPTWVERMVLPSDVPVVLDYDDAIFHRYDLHRSALVRGLLGKKIARLMGRAALVVAGNAYLADYARNAGAARVEVVPTVVDLERYALAAPADRDEPPTVGWIGTPETWRACVSGHIDLLCRIAAETGARVSAVGARPLGGESAAFDFPAWSEATEGASIAACDIGIMPLPDSPWMRGKCGYKLIQYMASGLPVVASPVGANREIVEHGVNGFLAETEAEWRAALIELIGDADLRRRMGQEGRRKVERLYSLQEQGPRVARLLRSLAG